MTLRQIFKSITLAEWRWVTALGFLMIVITTAPLLYGFLITPSGSEFTGIHFAAPNDWFVYYSYIEQVKQGHLLFRDLFASEPHTPVLNILWLAVGFLAKIFNLSAIVAFNLARIFLIGVFYFILYLFLAYWFEEIKWRRWLTVFISFSSGLGILQINRIIQFPFNFAHNQFNWPMDLWVPESNTFLTLYYSPHFIASLSLILLTFFLLVLAVDNHKLSYSFLAGLSAAALFEFHPFHILTIFVVTLIYYFIIWRRKVVNFIFLAASYLILFFVSLPVVGYYLYLLKTDWVTQQKAAQNLTFTTPLWLTLVSYGLLLPLFVYGWCLVVKKNNLTSKNILLLVWPVVQFFLIYFPVNYQRRLTEGLHLPLAIFSGIAIVELYRRLQNNQQPKARWLLANRYAFIFLFGALLISSNIFALASDLFIYADQRDLAYLPRAEVAAATWLSTLPGNIIVFNSASNIVNIIPAYSGQTVFVGHGVETPDFGSKQMMVNYFFSNNRDVASEHNWLKKNSISYLYYGPAEQKLGHFNPELKNYLKLVYRNDLVSIYQVL
ncbi:MAG: hypothetical protein PHW95_01890 [Patescibacteria group bacterium]|nr:hypothetical protein [Patescibacteria group bacterium]